MLTCVLLLCFDELILDTGMYERSSQSAHACVVECIRARLRVKLAESDSRARLVRVWAPCNSEPSPTEGPGEPSRTRPSPARGAPYTDEFGSLGPEPSQTRTCMGTFKGLPARKPDSLTAICEPIV
jgi:hypothetical protein